MLTMIQRVEDEQVYRAASGRQPLLSSSRRGGGRSVPVGEEARKAEKGKSRDPGDVMNGHTSILIPVIAHFYKEQKIRLFN